MFLREDGFCNKISLGGREALSKVFFKGVYLSNPDPYFEYYVKAEPFDFERINLCCFLAI